MKEKLKYATISMKHNGLLNCPYTAPVPALILYLSDIGHVAKTVALLAVLIILVILFILKLKIRIKSWKRKGKKKLRRAN